MTRKSVKLLLSGAAVMAGLLSGLPAVAQGDEAEATAKAPTENDRETIVVTASKAGATELLKTAVTANVVTGAKLERQEIRNPEDLKFAVPGVYIDAGSSTPRVSIRGVGFDNFQIQAENGVAIYIDGVIIQRTQAVPGAFNDLERIEVLKGPQVSSYGRNATGGAINLITRKPEEGFSGQVSAAYGSFDRRKFGGVLNYGGEKFGIRVSGFHENDDGYITNLVTGNNHLNDTEQTVGRIALSFTPSDKVSVNYSFNYLDSDRIAPAAAHQNAVSAGTAIFLGGLIGLTPLVTPAAVVADDSYTVALRFDPHTKGKSKTHTLTIDLDLGSVALKSITGYIDFNQDWSSVVASPNAFAEGQVDVPFFLVDSEQVSQEVVLSGTWDRLKWVTGFYYLHEKVTDNTLFNFNIPPLAPPVGVVSSIDNGQKLDSIAAYFDGKFDITDRLRFNAGIRWTRDKKDAFGTTSAIILPIFGGFQVPGTGLPLDGTTAKTSKVTWQAGLEFDVTDDVFTFFRVSEGSKAGGINNNSGLTYDPETIYAYEVGIKGSFDSLSVSVAGFYNDYKDIQAFVSDSGNPIPEVVNAAKASILGVDFEAALKLPGGFSIDAAFTWMPRARYDEFMAFDQLVGGPPLIDFTGARLTRSPEFTGVFGINFDRNISDRWAISARVDLYVTSEIAFSQYAFLRPDFLTQPGYTIVNLNLALIYDDRVELRFYAKNLGNTFYLPTIVESVAFQFAEFGRPRELGGEVLVRF